MNYFSEFLYSRRKALGLTQQNVADELGVSNKAVSKWEAGECYPETAQLVPLASLLGCSVDELLRGRTAEKSAESPAEKPSEPSEERATERADSSTEKGAAQESEQEAESEPLSVYFKRKLKEAVGIAVGTALIIFAVAVGAILNYFWKGEEGELLGGAVMLALIAVGVGIIVFSAIAFGDKDGDKDGSTGEQTKREDPWCGVVMLAATIMFFVLGFGFHGWAYSWLAFPVGILICALIKAIFASLKK